MTEEQREVIPISDARRISQLRSCSMVVIVGLDERGETFAVTSYGQTKSLCRYAAGVADRIVEAAEQGLIFEAGCRR